ncbi:MAG: Spy/CpxP family protein refolding chaperone [Betaproteobacteria bacterium]|nr:Spy/CpxP family protein refolding chaperone [Betaproteobacteria bacterium]MDE2623539.1 Spy/CpxP family protein refolding chaperone [Betaproteobacteria bacterium]
MKSVFKHPLIWIAGSALLFSGAPAQAGPTQDQAPPSSFAQTADWAGHTQELLTDLKSRLALTASQATAWDAWSEGALKDARAQGEQMRALLQSRAGSWNPDLTTPERMSRKADRLRAQISMMQAHLSRVEAAQKRTRAFYNLLDLKQRTIFDLFWRQDYGNEAWPGHGMMMFREGRGYGPMGRGCPPSR